MRIIEGVLSFLICMILYTCGYSFGYEEGHNDKGFEDAIYLMSNQDLSKEEQAKEISKKFKFDNND
jgi:hypothetical protein